MLRWLGVFLCWFSVRRYFATIYRNCDMYDMKFPIIFFKAGCSKGSNAEVENDMHSEYQLISSSLSYIYTVIGIMCAVCHRFGDYYFRLVHGIFCCCCCSYFLCRYWIKFDAHLHFLVIFEFIKTKQWAGCCFFILQKKNYSALHFF